MPYHHIFAPHLDENIRQMEDQGERVVAVKRDRQRDRYYHVFTTWAGRGHGLWVECDPEELEVRGESGTVWA